MSELETVEVSQDVKPIEPKPGADFHVVLYRYVLARLREPVTWVSMGVAFKMIEDNYDQIWTLHGALQVGGAVLGIMLRSPGSPWQIQPSKGAL